MIEFLLYISDHKIKNERSVAKSFGQLSDGKYMVKITRANQRSLQQNKFYWAVCVPMVKDGLRDMGYDAVRTESDAHEVLKALFLKTHFVNEKTGEAIEYVCSTTKLSTVLFMDYIESIIRWAAEYLNVQIPFPGEQVEISY